MERRTCAQKISVFSNIKMGNTKAFLTTLLPSFVPYQCEWTDTSTAPMLADGRDGCMAPAEKLSVDLVGRWQRFDRDS